MSWFSKTLKKLTKIQPGKIITNAVSSVAKNLPVVGGLIGTIEGAVDKTASALQSAKGTSTTPGLWDQITGIFKGASQTVGNVNQAAKDTSKTSNYIIIGVIAIVAIALIFIMRKST